MNESMIAAVIILTTIILYSCGKIPAALVSILSLSAMVISGLLSFDEAFKGFASSTLFTIIGMMIIGQALFENGIARKIGEIAFGKKRRSERLLVARIFLVTALLSAFLYNTSVIVMMIPITAAYVEHSEGKLQKKSFYMALSHGTIFGSRMTLIGSDGFLMAHEVLKSAGINFRFGFFEPFPIMFLTVLVLAAAYYFILYPLGNKVFAKEESMDCQSFEEKKDYDPRKARISGAVIIIVSLSAALIHQINTVIPNLNLGIIALMGAAVLCLTGCVDFEEQMRKLNLSTLAIVGSSYGFAACFLKTGLGDRLVELLTGAGDTFRSPVLLIFLFCAGSALITNLMSNAAAVTILTSLAITIATGLGMDFAPLVMAVVCGTAGGVMLPTSTSTLTMSMEAGYRYTDYIKIGGVVFLISSIVESAMIAVMY